MAGPGGREVGRVSLRVVPDSSGFRQRLRNTVERVERGIFVQLPVQLNARGARNDLRALMARLQVIADGGIEIPVRVTSRGFKQLNEAQQEYIKRIRRSQNFTSRLAQGILAMVSVAAPALGRLSSASSQAAGLFGRLGAAAAVAVVALLRMGVVLTVMGAAIGVVIGGVTALVSLLGTAFLGLSGLLAGIAAPIGVIALGLDGIKKAAETAKPAFDRLKQTISNTFERGLTPVFERIANVLIPSVTGGLNGIAEALVGVAQNFVTWVTQAPQLTRINTILGTVSKNLTDLGPLAEVVMDSFLTLADVGTRAFNRFVDGPLTRVINQFNQMVTQLARDGTLGRAFDGLGAAVGGLLFLFNELLRISADITAKFGPEISGLFRNLATTLENNQPVIERFVQAFIDFGNFAINKLPAALNTLDKFINVMRAVAKVVGTVADAIQRVNSFFGTMPPKVTESGQRSVTEADKYYRNKLGESLKEGARKGANFLRTELFGLPPVARQSGQQTTQGLGRGLAPMPGVGERAANQTANAVGRGLDRGKPEASQAGRGMMDGLRTALDNGRASVISTAVAVAIAAWRAAKNALGISSPSKLFIGIGEDVIAGFREGIEANVAEVTTAIRTLISIPAATLPDIPDVANSEITRDSLEELVAGIIAGLTGSTLKVDGRGVAQLVNSINQRNAIR